MRQVSSVRFNRDFSFFICCVSDGFRIFSVEPLMQLQHVTNQQIGCSGVLQAELLRKTNLVALVVSGCENVVKIWDSVASKVRREISFNLAVLNMRFRADKLVVVLLNKIHTLAYTPDITNLSSYDTRDNPMGLCVVNSGPSSATIAFPGKDKPGSVQIADLSQADSFCTVAPVTISAHEHELACLALNMDATILATASRHGTLIRVFDLLRKEKVMELRRGSDTALVYSLNFSSDSTFLCAASDKGTAHIFAVADPSLNRRSTLHKVGGIISPYSGSQWGVANFAVPAEMACTCAFLIAQHHTVIAVCVDGTYHKYVFKQDGGCSREAFDQYLELGDSMEMYIMASNKSGQQLDKKALTESKEAQLKAYEKQVRDDIASMLDNFTEMIRQAKISDGSQMKQSTDGEHSSFEISVRAANVVRAGESLMKLVSELKQFLILNDFSSIGECTQNSRAKFKNLEEDIDRKLISLRDEVASSLYVLEDEYFNSTVK